MTAPAQLGGGRGTSDPPRRGRVGGVEYLLVGDGPPVTVFAHGIGGSVAESRPLAAPLPGTRVLLTLRGHGRSAPLPDGWEYDDYAADIAAVADATGATRALGVSLGAGALLRLVATTPDRFDRLAFVLPAALDRPRGDAATERLRRLGHALAAADVDAAAAMLLEDVPAALRSTRAAQVLVRRRAQDLTLAVPPAPRGNVRPLESAAVLAAVRAPALVLGQREDPLHPEEVARALAAALPAGRLVLLPPGGVFWGDRGDAARALAETFA